MPIDTCETKDICFVAFNPCYDYYHNEQNKERFIKELNTTYYDFCDIYSNESIKNKFTILLSHTPQGLIENKRVISSQRTQIIEDIDLSISGHMHNGLIPYFFQNNSGRGLLSPGSYKPFPKNCYGIYNNNDTIVQINGPLDSLSDTTGLRAFNKLYSPNIYVLDIDPSDNTEIITKTTRKLKK